MARKKGELTIYNSNWELLRVKGDAINNHPGQQVSTTTVLGKVLPKALMIWLLLAFLALPCLSLLLMLPLSSLALPGGPGLPSRAPSPALPSASFPTSHTWTFRYS